MVEIKKKEIDRAVVFLQIGLSRMGDKRGVSSDEIEVDADKDLVKVRKVIFKSHAFDRIKSLDSEIRRYVRGVCFPWESGLHMVAKPTVELINLQLERYEVERHEYIRAFANVWPNIREEFPDKLRKLWKEQDYDINDIPSQFSMYWNFMELKVPLDLEAVNSELFQTEQRKFRARMEEAYEEARMILRETCLQLVKHLRLSLQNDAYGASKRIHSSTVTKLQDFLNIFDLRNITNDVELKSLTDQIKGLIGNVSADFLRSSDYHRNQIHHELEGVEHSLTEAVTVAPTRRIRV